MNSVPFYFSLSPRATPPPHFFLSTLSQHSLCHSLENISPASTSPHRNSIIWWRSVNKRLSLLRNVRQCTSSQFISSVALLHDMPAINARDTKSIVHVLYKRYMWLARHSYFICWRKNRGICFYVDLHPSTSLILHSHAPLSAPTPNSPLPHGAKKFCCCRVPLTCHHYLVMPSPRWFFFSPPCQLKKLLALKSRRPLFDSAIKPYTFPWSILNEPSRTFIRGPPGKAW